MVYILFTLIIIIMITYCCKLLIVYVIKIEVHNTTYNNQCYHITGRYAVLTKTY